ncbi:hypothetical protein DPMN_093383 [Dreissena polymorpha]|uniref:Uncharacterized protein n=1 Tax=Dreissena polymorpha TaxID=45954 RepID=A0A9D4R1U2_DREPO|nr:hypothetical protein DPMN_093383 [Dreissena polymorpha]
MAMEKTNRLMEPTSYMGNQKRQGKTTQMAKGIQTVTRATKNGKEKHNDMKWQPKRDKRR